MHAYLRVRGQGNSIAGREFVPLETRIELATYGTSLRGDCACQAIRTRALGARS